jgi:hypothetical protein
MAGKLVFPLQHVLGVAKATVAAPAHAELYGEVTGPALWWVKDQGTYIMSNAIPRPEGDLIYARTAPKGQPLNGEGDGQYELVARICGGDDFAEAIRLTPEFVEALEIASKQQFGWVVIRVRADNFTLEVTK